MTIELEIVSPDRIVLSRAVEMVVLPGAEGDLGILVHHAPMIVALRPGAIRLFEGGKVTEEFPVDGGFAEITGERVTVLATVAIAEPKEAAAPKAA